MSSGGNAGIGKEHPVMRALKRLAWKVGGEHKLFETLKDDAGVVSVSKLARHLEDTDGITAEEALDWLDSNRDGKVCSEDLDDRVVRKLFEEQFLYVAGRSGERMLRKFAQSIPRTTRGKPVVHCLAEMSDDQMQEYAAEALPELLASLKELREEIQSAKKKKQPANGAASKFSFQPADKEGQTFLFGNLEMFKQGLDKLIGIPATHVSSAMRREHQSTERFTTGNYGINTFDRQEFDLVDKNCDVDYSIDAPRERKDVDELLRGFKGKSVLESLTRDELVALVLYTGPMFDRYNRVLRTTLFPIAQRMLAGEEIDVDTTEVEFVTTIHMIVSGILKLSAMTSLEGGRKVYRGLKGRLLPESFTKADENGCRGGTELAFMSTTTDISVAKEYADVENAQWPTIFVIETGQVDRAASLQILSQYPGEAEMLLPPLCNLEMTGDPQVVWEGDLGYWMIPLRLSVNLKSSTREQHEERRKREVMGTASTALLDTKEALLSKMRSQEKVNPNDGTALYTALLGEAIGLQSRMRTTEAGWFNNDVNFGTAMQDVQNMRSYALETMDAFTQDKAKHSATYFTQYSMTMWHRLRVGNARAECARAMESKDASGCKAAAEQLLVLQGHLVEGGDPDRKTGLDSETALIKCAAAGDEEALGLLADARCNMNATDARHGTALLAAVCTGHDGAVKKLLALGADPEKGKMDSEESPLQQAAEHGRLECMKRLKENRADVEAGSHQGFRATHCAASNGHLECMKWLTENGADVEAAANNGRRPIHNAAGGGHVECMKWLKENGADVEAKTNDGLRPIHDAACCGHVECMKWLKENGADFEAKRNDGLRPIHEAAAVGHVECMKWLKKEGADVNAATNRGTRPIDFARRQKQEACVKWLEGGGE